VTHTFGKPLSEKRDGPGVNPITSPRQLAGEMVPTSLDQKGNLQILNVYLFFLKDLEVALKAIRYNLVDGLKMELKVTPLRSASQRATSPHRWEE